MDTFAWYKQIGVELDISALHLGVDPAKKSDTTILIESTAFSAQENKFYQEYKRALSLPLAVGYHVDIDMNGLGQVYTYLGSRNNNLGAAWWNSNIHLTGKAPPKPVATAKRFDPWFREVEDKDGKKKAGISFVESEDNGYYVQLHIKDEDGIEHKATLPLDVKAMFEVCKKFIPIIQGNTTIDWRPTETMPEDYYAF